MELPEAIRVLEEFQKWRRYDGEIDSSPSMPSPKRIGEAIDKILTHLKK